MKIKDIRNLHVTAQDGFSGRFSVGWEDEVGDRYHYWAAKNGLVTPFSRPAEVCIYKNPPRGTERGSVRDFKTRYLDADKANWREIINATMQTVIHLGLVQEATAKAAAAKQAKIAEAAAKRVRSLRAYLNALATQTPERLTDSARQGVLRLVDHASDDDLTNIANAIFNAETGARG